MTQILPACFGAKLPLALGGLGRSQIRKSWVLNQLSSLLRPPSRAGRRGQPSEIKFRKLLLWYILFTQQFPWLNNCLTLGLLALRPGLVFLSPRSHPCKRLGWAAFRPSKRVLFFFLLKAQQLLGKCDLANGTWRLEHLLSSS